MCGLSNMTIDVFINLYTQTCRYPFYDEDVPATAPLIMKEESVIDCGRVSTSQCGETLWAESAWEDN